MKEQQELLKEYTNWLLDNFEAPRGFWGYWTQRLGSGISFSIDQMTTKFLDERQKGFYSAGSKGSLAGK